MRRPNRRPPGPPPLLVVLAATGALLAGCAPGESPQAPSAAKPADGAVAPASPAAAASEPALSFADLPRAVSRLEVLRQEVEDVLSPDEGERAVAAGLQASLLAVERFPRFEGLPYDELLEAVRVVATADERITSMGSTVASRLRKVEEKARAVAELQATFAAFAELAGRSGAPPAIRERTEACQSQLGEMAGRLSARRNDLLVLVGTLAEVSGKTASVRAETERRLEGARRRLAAVSEKPIWGLGASFREVASVTAERLTRDTQRARSWVREQSVRLLWVAVFVFGGTVLLLSRLRPGVARRAETDPVAVATLRIMQSPIAAAIPVTVLVVLMTSPTAPAIVYSLAWSLAAPAAAWVIVRMIGAQAARTIWVLAAALAFDPVRHVLGAHPLTDRLALAVQAAPLAVILGLDLHGRRLEQHATGPLSRLLRLGGWALAACLAVAVAGSLAGRAELASVLSAGALGSLGGLILSLASYLVLGGLLRAVLSSAPARKLRMVAGHADTIGDTVLRVLGVVASLTAALVALSSFQLIGPLGQVLASVTGVKLTLGALSVSGGAIVTFVLVLSATVAVARLAGFLLSEEVLPRLELGRGVAFAASVTTRYVILLAGFVLAAGAAGIDLSKVGFLAGALGVGIGFGLQNVVNNFVSGLILLFERPIQVGDAVEVSGASGSVTRIGIRASIVRTFDGAEVIVPNADLISKPVTNWTLSDPNRRYDVGVGVAYGSPLETTAQALLAAARRTRGILPAPAAEAFFQSFGASSLDWTLRVWVRMDESPQVLSELKRAMLEELVTAGIEVPFPQRDLHVRSVSPEVAEALGGAVRPRVPSR